MTITRERPANWVMPAETRTVRGRELQAGDVDADDGDTVEAVLGPFHGTVLVKWAGSSVAQEYGSDDEYVLAVPTWSEETITRFDGFLRRSGLEAYADSLQRMAAEERGKEAGR